MSYRLYSRDVLLGETELEYQTESDTIRMGAFRPTPDGETLMPVLTGVQAAYHELFLQRARGGNDARPGAARAMPDANVVAAQSRLEALALELRSPEGRVLPVEWVSIQDSEELISWSDRMEASFPDRHRAEHEAEIDAAIAHDLELINAWFDEREDSAEPWEADEDRGECPRYQISVELTEPL